MSISPFTPIQIIQTELHNWLTPRDKEDRLHSELRGHEYEFKILRNGEPQEVALSVENIGLDPDNAVILTLRLKNYECPTEISDWEEDILFLYISCFLRGKGSPRELGNPLLSDIEVLGRNPHDLRFGIVVYSTYQSRIIHAIGRIASIIDVYHSDHFQYMRELYEEEGDQFKEDEESPHLGHGIEVARRSDHHNEFQASTFVSSYVNYKIAEQEKDDSHISTQMP